MWLCCMWFDMFCVCGERKSRSFRSLRIKKVEKPFGQRAKIRLYQCLVIRQEAEGEMETGL